jgi:hypothetical protein
MRGLRASVKEAKSSGDNAILISFNLGEGYLQKPFRLAQTSLWELLPYIR